MNIDKLIKQLEKRAGNLAIERDKLRDLEDDIAMYRENTRRAIESLEECIEVLSELI